MDIKKMWSKISLTVLNFPCIYYNILFEADQQHF